MAKRGEEWAEWETIGGTDRSIAGRVFPSLHQPLTCTRDPQGRLASKVVSTDRITVAPDTVLCNCASSLKLDQHEKILYKGT
jgi:hypothetical protein